MNWLDSIILGVVQGLTEFLPVSSSGHLVLFQHWLGVEEHSIVFDLAVHLGTILSVITVYFTSIKKIMSDLYISTTKKQKTNGLMLMLAVFVASVPTAVIGFGFKPIFESMFNNIHLVGVCFFITATLLFLTRNKGLTGKMVDDRGLHDFSKMKEIPLLKALVVGIAQGLAIAPGISRSGTTIAVGILIGLERPVAAMFSFMMSIPAILGASLLQFKDVTVWNSDLLLVLIVGGLVSYLAGLVGLLLILKFVTRGRLEVFSYYLWALSIFIFAS